MKKTLIALAMVTAGVAHAGEQDTLLRHQFRCAGNYHNMQLGKVDTSGFEMEFYKDGGIYFMTSEGPVYGVEATDVRYVNNRVTFRAWDTRYIATCEKNKIVLESEFGTKDVLQSGSYVIKHSLRVIHQ